MTDLSVSQQQLPVQVAGKTFASRAWAYIIDFVVYLLVTFVVSFVVGGVVGTVLSLAGREFQIVDDPSLKCINQIVGLFQFALYFAIFEYFYGATLGKLVLGMRVIMTNGEPCTFGAAFVRSMFRYIDGLLFGLPAYNSMKDPLYQRLGDKSAKTIVVDAKDVIIQQPRDWWWFLIAAGLYLVLEVVVTLILLSVSIR